MSLLSLPFIYFAASVVFSIASLVSKKDLYSWAVCSLLASIFFFRALTTVKVGTRQRKLGTPHCGGRRLGWLERWYVASSRAGIQTGFVIAMEFNNLDSPTKTTKDVKEALTRVSQRFPWLRARLRRDGINGVDSQYRLHQPFQERAIMWGDDLYVTVENKVEQPYDFREVSSTLKDVLEYEGKMRWHDEDPTKPLWRVTMIRSQGTITLVLSFHHMIIDGIGSMAVVEAILEEGSNAGTVHPSINYLPPPFEDFVDTTPTVKHLCMPFLLDRFPNLMPYLKSPHWQGIEHMENPKLSDRVPHMMCTNILPLLNVDKLKRYCNKNRVSINSVFVTTIAKAISRVVVRDPREFGHNRLNNKQLQLTIQSAVDERRRRVQLPPTVLGSYVSGAHVRINVGSDSHTAELAHLYQNNLYRAIQTSIMDIGMTQFISEDWIDFAKKNCKAEPNGIQNSLDVSDLGMQHFSKHAWKLSNLWFAQGRIGMGSAIHVQMVGGPQGYNAVLSAFPCTVSKEMLSEIRDEWCQEIAILL
jgi:Alcohol acetyltransferase